MFVVFLKFASNRELAAQHMEDHNEWIKRGFADGVFLMVGGLNKNQGGAVVAHNTSLSELEKRVKADPFVEKSVVVAEIVEITPARADERLNFLL